MGRDDDVVTAIGSGKIDFLLATNRSDDGGAQGGRPLSQQRPYAAGSGMNQDNVAGRYRECLPTEISRCDSLDQYGSCDSTRDRRGQLDELLHRHQPRLGICS